MGAGFFLRLGGDSRYKWYPDILEEGEQAMLLEASSGYIRGPLARCSTVEAAHHAAQGGGLLQRDCHTISASLDARRVHQSHIFEEANGSTHIAKLPAAKKYSVDKGWAEGAWVPLEMSAKDGGGGGGARE